MENDLPPQIMQAASLRGNEYGWPVDSFPDAVMQAKSLGYACLGGQFQFRLQDGTCEMYWLSADSNDRRADEEWSVFAQHPVQRFWALFKHWWQTQISRNRPWPGRLSKKQ